MRSYSLGLLASAVVAIGVATIGNALQPPPPRGQEPPRYELGKLLPPFARQAIQLTDEQKKQLAELEKEVKAKLEEILTPEQIKTLEETRPPMGRRGEQSTDRREPPPPLEISKGGIQWFATWESAKAEAARTNKPILMVSAAPHCSGVSGIW